ncbi:MAG: ABC transporter ATP-binding protein [Chloroflexota bacterium]
MAGSGTAHLRQLDDLTLRVVDLVVDYHVGRGTVQAVSSLSLDVAAGETLGLVGESGCGKSSAARAILQLPPPTSGQVLLGGDDLTLLRGEALRRIRPRLQVVLQDPSASLNPRRTVRQLIMEPMDIWHVPRAEALERVDAAMSSVGLVPELVAHRRPHQLSGGQRQRVSIARAVVLRPELVILDEPLSSLDVSIQAQILELLRDLKHRLRLSILMISHDLAVVKNISDRVAVMFLGKLCEIGPADQVLEAPAHPYTRELTDAIPTGTRAGRQVDDGERTYADPPSPVTPPSGCRFRTRCPRAADRCSVEEPTTRAIAPDRFVACHFPLIDLSVSTSRT